MKKTVMLFALVPFAVLPSLAQQKEDRSFFGGSKPKIRLEPLSPEEIPETELWHTFGHMCALTAVGMSPQSIADNEKLDTIVGTKRSAIAKLSRSMTISYAGCSTKTTKRRRMLGLMRSRWSRVSKRRS